MINPLADRQVRAGLPDHFKALWRGASVLAGSGPERRKLVDKTIAKIVRDASDYTTGSPLRRWLLKQLVAVWKADRPAADGLQAQTNDDLARAVVGLPANQRVIALLVYGEDMRHRDVAKTLRLPLGVVMTRLTEARASLAPIVRQESADASSPQADAPRVAQLDDATLVAYLDGRLSPRDRVLVDTKFNKTPELDARLAAADDLAPKVHAALTPLGDGAPLDELQATLDAAVATVVSERDVTAVDDTVRTVARLKKLQRAVMVLAVIVVGIAIYLFFQWGPGATV